MIENKRNIRIIIVALFALGFAIYLGVKISNGFSENNMALAEHLPFSYTITTEDSCLIALKYRDRIKVDEVYHSTVREPVSLIFYDKAYHLIVHKIHLKQDTSLKSLLNIEIKSVDRSTGHTYAIVDHSIFFRFQYKAGLVQPVSKIFLTLAGDSLQEIIKNDSVLSYHLLCDNLSIRYAENDPIDIFVIGEEKMFGNTTVIPMDLLFLKRNGAIYLLIMTPNSPKSTIAPDLLYNAVMGR